MNLLSVHISNGLKNRTVLAIETLALSATLTHKDKDTAMLEAIAIMTHIYAILKEVPIDYSPDAVEDIPSELPF